MRRFATWSATPTVQIVLHAALAVLFMVMIPVTLITGLKQSVPFLVGISLWALVAAHWSSALAADAARISAENPDPNTGEPKATIPAYDE